MDTKRRIMPARARRRAGAATLDYVLVLGVILPMVAFVMWAGPRIIRLAYEMIAVLVSWPFI
jgi:hypothetical protein